MRPTQSFQRLTDLLFPPACAVCSAPTGVPEALCGSCWSEIGFLDGTGCARCGRPVVGAGDDPAAICEECQAHPPAWRRGAGAFRYDGAGRKLVLSLKHADRQDGVPMLGRWLARAGADLLAGADLVAPVPLHWTRRLKRRGNQAALLARAVCAAADRREAFAPRLMIRTRGTPSQGGRDRDARAANVAQAFACPATADISGRRVVLVDDVMTTGATLSEAARCCLAAGAASVDVLVLALVVRDDTSYIAAETEDLP